jgi:hypothetical protein
VICYDPFHAVELVTDALDVERRKAWNELRAAGDVEAARKFKGARWGLVKNLTDLDPGQALVSAASLRQGRQDNPQAPTRILPALRLGINTRLPLTRSRPRPGHARLRPHHPAATPRAAQDSHRLTHNYAGRTRICPPVDVVGKGSFFGLA